MGWGTETTPTRWTRDEVEKALREILVDALGVDEEKVVPEASLVHDLGAESIDFLDIGFRVQQTFGVELPNKAVQDGALSWRNMGELGRILEQRYGAHIAPDELRQFHTMGIPEVLRWLSEKHGIVIQNGEGEKIAQELADRLARGVEAIGFRASLIDKQEIVRQLFQSLNSPKIVEGMTRLFSVGALVDFISSRVEGKKA